MAKEVYQVPKTAGDLFFNYRLTAESCSSSEVEFRIKNQVTWLTVAQESIPGYDNPFRVHYGANPGAPREGTIIPVIKTGGAEKACEEEWGIVISQTGDTCTCGDLNLSTNPLEWSSNETTPKYKSYSTAGGCINVTTATSNNNHFSVSVGADNITVTPTATTSTNDETGVITVTYTANGGTCTNATFDVIHNGTQCGCGNFLFNQSELTWGSNEVNEQYKTYTEKGDCITVVTATSNNNHFTVTTSDSGITVKPTGTNTGTDSITGTVTVQYTANGGNCTSKTFDVKHSGTGCDCYISIVGVTDWPATLYGSNYTKYIQYNFDSSCIDGNSISITNSNETDFYAELDRTNKKIAVYPKNENTDKNNPKTATITISFSGVEGFSCSNSQTTTLTQKKSDKCDDCGLIDTLEKTSGYVGDNIFIFPRTATTYTFASGSTRAPGESTACGDFSAATTSTTATFTIERTNYDRKFKVTFNRSNETTASSLRLYFKYNDGRPDCFRDFWFIQQECNCINANGGWSKGTFVTDPLKARAYTNEDLKKKNFIDTSCLEYTVTKNGSWIIEPHIRQSDSSAYTYITADVEANTGTTERTAYLYVKPKITYNNTQYECGTDTLTVRQEGADCSCGESTETKNVSSESGNEYFFGDKHYNANCFSTPSDPSTFFTITSDKSWAVITGNTYDETGGMYRPYAKVAYEANLSTQDREATISVKVNLKNDNSCTTTWKLKQSGVTSETCEVAMAKVYGTKASSSNIKSYTGSRSSVAAYTGASTEYTLKITGTTPSWLSNFSNDYLGFDKKYLYADFTANSGTTAGVPDDPLYKTPERSATISVYLEHDNGTTCNTKSVTVRQEGWSGSCSCEGTINYTQSTCGVEKTASGKTYHAFSYTDDSTPQVLCYYNLSDLGECDIKKAVASSDQSGYFVNSAITTATTSVTIGDVTYDRCVKAIIKKFSGDTDTPVSILLTLHRNIGGSNYEKCDNNFRAFEILINTDKNNT